MQKSEPNQQYTFQHNSSLSRYKINVSGVFIPIGVHVDVSDCSIM